MLANIQSRRIVSQNSEAIGAIRVSAEVITNHPSTSTEITEDLIDLDIEADVQDSVRLYLNSIGNIPLLSAAEEQELAKNIEAGLFAEQILLDEDSVVDTDRAVLSEIVRIGSESYQRIINANLRLVVSMAKRYQHTGVPILDLIQEGNIALMHAVKKFDYKRGYKLSTTATLWIRKALITATYQQSPRVSMTEKEGEKLNLIRKTQSALLGELQREPTYEEIASATGIRDDVVKELLLASRIPISVDQPINETDGDLTFRDMLSEMNTVYLDTEEHQGSEIKNEKSEMLDLLLQGLSERYQGIIRGLYGIGDDEKIKTPEELGREFEMKSISVKRSHDIIINKLGKIAQSLALKN